MNIRRVQDFVVECRLYEYAEPALASPAHQVIPASFGSA
jgi:hypothetical protein